MALPNASPVNGAALDAIPVRANLENLDSRLVTVEGARVTSVTAGTGISVTGAAATPTVALGTSGVTAGTYQGIQVDTHGRVISATNQGYTTNAGTVTGVTAANTSITIAGTAAAPTVAVTIPVPAGGTSGHVLTSNGAAAPTWQAAGGGGVTSVTAGGGITVTGAAATPTVAVTIPVPAGGTAGHVLTSNGAAAPTWQAAGGGGGMTALTGDVTASGTGSVAATVARLQGGIALSGTPSANQVLTATSATAAHWATPTGGGGGGPAVAILSTRAAAGTSGHADGTLLIEPAGTLFYFAYGDWQSVVL